MNIPTIFDVLAWIDGLRRKLPGASPEAGWLDLRAHIRAQAERENEEVVGRFDVPERVPGRDLEDVAVEDEDLVSELGAYRDSDGSWHVPEGEDLLPFADWWPKVPEDLRDSTPRMQRTKSGQLIEANVLAEDQGKGQDSTATSLMFAALPVIAALTFTLTQAIGYGLSALLLAVPYLVSIKQSEGAWTAVKAAALLLILPLVMVGAISISISLNLGLAGWVIVIALCLIAGLIAFAVKCAEKGFSAAVEKLIGMIKFAFLLVIVVIAGLVLGLIYKPLMVLWVFTMASLYPLYYVNSNFMDRAVRLDAQSKLFNLGTQGVLASSHVQARKTQAEVATRDKSPLILIGTATGHTTAKQYQYAPDAKKQMFLSLMDMLTHMIVFGKTGGGKTTSAMRPIAYLIRITGKAGALILDAKGALVDEIRSLMDLVIEPGVRFGLIQGMAGTDVVQSFRQSVKVGSDGEDSVWANGAMLACEHAVTITEALCQHENAVKMHALSVVEQCEREIRWLGLEAERLAGTGEAADHIPGKIAQCQERRKVWMAELVRPKRWTWTMANIARFLGLMENLVPSGNDKWALGPELQGAMTFLGWGLSEEDPRHMVPESIHPGIGRHGPLDLSLRYLTTSWVGLPQEQRTSFYLNINNLIQPLLRGAKLVDDRGIPWNMIEKGEDVTRALRGEFVGVDLPEVQHGEAGRLVQSLVKQRIYSEVRKRKGEPHQWPEGHLPMMLMIDEAQLLVGEEERNLLPIARSLGMMAVFATQTYEGLMATFQTKYHTDHFCNTFQNLICLDSSIATLEYVSNRLGQAELVAFKTPTVGLDYAGAVMNLAKSAGSDLNHPSRSGLRQIERRGGSEFEVAVPTLRGVNQSEWKELRDVKSIDDAALSARVKVPVGGVKEIQPVLSVEEMTSLLRTKGAAVVLLNRAGTPRVDVAQLNPITEAEARRLPRVAKAVSSNPSH